MQVLVRKNIRQHRACELVGLPRSSLSYRPHPRHHDQLRERIKTLAHEHPRWGCRRVHATLRREGVQVNRKTVHRLWKSEGLALPIQRKARKIRTGQHPPLRAEQPNQVWTYDFVFDRTLTGRPLKILTLTDEFTRQSLALRCGTAFTSAD
ncbi:MAG: IS3 family transposase, partial [Deinococcota bacterium]